ncbi:hypothetical protein EYF80_035911 [Liparis tanakae]|uniref:Uncharacterized protein n=1 Tax=Liparis tanakae TaxID=230148 RepID=A0A4Z2GKV4_9TELE|nr:hypothetical protein EYF80_035911 [Liparis tanakae]
MSHSGVFFLSLSAEEEEEEVVEWRVERGGGDKKIHLLTDSAILDFFCSSPSSVTWSAPALTRGGLSRTKTC